MTYEFQRLELESGEHATVILDDDGILLVLSAESVILSEGEARRLITVLRKMLEEMAA